jgi:hypothetical protein
MLLTWLGALLVLGGVLFAAAQAFRRWRGFEFGLRANWPGYVLIILGAILLLARAWLELSGSLDDAEPLIQDQSGIEGVDFVQSRLGVGFGWLIRRRCKGLGRPGAAPA